MGVFNLKKEKKPDSQQAEVPDELPSLDDSSLMPPKPETKQASQEAQQPVTQAPPMPEIPAAPRELAPAMIQPVEQEIRISAPSKPAPEPNFYSATTPKPTRLLDHISAVDSLREQVNETEKDILILTDRLKEKGKLLTSLKGKLESEVQIIKEDLGLEPKKTSEQEKITPDKYFYFGDGKFATTIAELAERLKTMSDDTFRHHCSQERNDFYEWIRTVFKDRETAERIKTARSRREMINILAESLER